MTLISKKCSIADAQSDSLRILKLVVGVSCLGAARPLVGGEYGLLFGLQLDSGLLNAVGSFSALVLVSTGVALLFGLYRGCRWCRLLSWMGWLLLPAVAFFFFASAICSASLNWDDPLKKGALLNHAVRYIAPVILLVWMWNVHRGSGVLTKGWMWALRASASATFLGHGLNALQTSPSHVELIQLTFGLGVSESAAAKALVLIGCIDVLVAVLLLVRPMRWVVGWMSVWGMIAVASRLTAYGFAEGWDAAAIRVGNAGVPLVIWMAWVKKIGKA